MTARRTHTLIIRSVALAGASLNPPAMEAGAFVAVLTTSSQLCFAGPGDPDADVSPEGIEINESRIADWMDQVRQGRGEDALSQIEQALKEAQKNRAPRESLNEIRLSMAMVLIRSGQPMKANHFLHGPASMKDDSDVVPRAKVLQAAAKRAPRESLDNPSLSREEDWAAALNAVGRQIATEMKRAHKSFETAMNKGNWSKLQPAAAQAWDLILQVEAIRVAGIGDLRFTMAQEQAESLAAAVSKLNLIVDKDVRRIAGLYDKIRIQQQQQNSRRDRRKGFYFESPDVRLHNNLCHEVETVWNAGNELIAEHKRIANRYSTRLRFPELRMKLPRERLPQPLVTLGAP